MTFFEKSNIEKWQTRSFRELRYAFRESRKAIKLTPLDRDKIRPRHAYRLLAVNHHSRMFWGQVLCDTISEFFCDGEEGSWHDREIFFVTLVHVGGARSRGHKLSEVELRKIKNHLRIGLRGCSYFGMIEPAYYLNLQSGVNFREKRCVFWHLHALVWGVEGKKLRARLKLLAAKGEYAAIADGKDPTRVESVGQGDLPSCVAYLVKYPDRGYRVWKRDAVGPDGSAIMDADGVVQPTFRHKAGQLRPGERIDLFHAMKHLDLEQLAMAGREGAGLFKKLKKRIDRIVDQKEEYRQRTSGRLAILKRIRARGRSAQRKTSAVKQ
ncbi:hypothetical protein [Bradyrhizobium sp. 62]|uniref:hypothetical protein n=1 Tax=Bradyrhizobium sp. 62 TaxID=1043588 RepID=UPI001FFC1D48|nr:hypothetical protein [Bradyrhizobium sp. 62]MCK1364070.1 hypothetical protein [Bradyrhizobium sp. 62]